ncbi:hypothetical protein M3Y94_01265400 [Aphelenchoides besseyi]|nr:hypothetical protein M3Y94_01265400 [Aphelenchoides besseyi]
MHQIRGTKRSSTSRLYKQLLSLAKESFGLTTKRRIFTFESLA